MRNYFITWEKVSYDKLNDNKDAHFYAFEQNGKLQYLGLSYELNLVDEVKESIQVFDLDIEQTGIWVGSIIRNIHNEVSQQLAEEIICLMVYNVKPERNVICKRSYYGRSGIEISSKGFDLIPASIHSELNPQVFGASVSGISRFAI